MKNFEKIIINDFIEFTKTKLNIKDKDINIVEIKNNNKIFGDIDIIELKNNIYNIRIIKDISLDYMIESIGHELKHISQFCNGLLDIKNNYILWKNIKYIDISDYNKIEYKDYIKLPWENEAIIFSKNILHEYKNSYRINKLKGKDNTLDYIIEENLFFSI